MNAAAVSQRTTVQAATLCSFVMIAEQISSKAVRDALFLSGFGIEALPVMVVSAALASLVCVLFAGRLLQRQGPARCVPGTFLVSAVALVLVALLHGRLPRVGAVLLYLHVAILGAILVSWFWSLMNERFDARTARRTVGRIAAGGTFGGLAGGVLAERVGTLFSPGAMLPVLAGLHVLCGVLATRIVTGAQRLTPTKAEDGLLSGLRTLNRSPYLRSLGLLVLLGTLGATLLDFAFKARAMEIHTQANSLVRFFAVFYAATALLAFVVQSTLVSRLLRTPQDLSRNVAVLPGVVALGGLLSVLLPGIVVVTAARGLESIVRNSLFRSSYEIFFNPVPATQKRPTKTIIDVGFDRLGDLLGGLLIQAVVLAVGVALGIPVLLVCCAGVALLAIWYIRRLHGGYVTALENVIRDHVSPAPLPDPGQASVELFRSQVTELHPSLHAMLADIQGHTSMSSSPPVAKPHPATADPGRTRLDDLLSRDAVRVRQALARREPLDADMVAAAVPLLAWDLVHGDAARALRRSLDAASRRLVEAMLDHDNDFAIRRRIPAILAASRAPEIVPGLVAALSDPRFEVRYQAALALARLHHRSPSVVVERRVILDIITREARVDQRMWNRRRLLDAVESESTPFYRDILRNRTHRSLEHLFHLLSLAFSAEPLRVAYDGLHTGDPVLRGTALEYLESILPPEVRRSLWPLLGNEVQPTLKPKPEKELLDSLLNSHQSILVQLQRLDRPPRGPGP